MSVNAVNAEKIRAYVCLALAMMTVGSIVPAAKVMAGQLPPFVAGAVRLAVAAAVLLPWAASRGGLALIGGFDRHDKVLLALQAAAGTVGFTVLMILGTARTSAADASVVTGALPAVAALVSVLLFREQPGRRRWLGIALATGGLAVVNLHDVTNGGLRRDRLLGNLLVLGAVVSESLFILLNKRLHRQIPALTQSAVMTGLGLIYVLPPALVEANGLDLGAVPAPAYLAAVYYGLVPTVLGFVWWYKGTERVSGVEAGVFTGVMPIAGAGLSALVLGERLGAHHAAGLGLVVAAIALAAGAGGTDVLRDSRSRAKISSGGARAAEDGQPRLGCGTAAPREWRIPDTPDTLPVRRRASASSRS